VPWMDRLAIPVTDQARSRRFYETYFAFGARPAKNYHDGVVGLPSREAVLALRDRFVDDGVELVEVSDEPTYVSVKCRASGTVSCR
jgi:hypothetical protein